MGLRTRQGEILQVCDGANCWSYNSTKNEFMKGERFRDVSTSVGSSVLLGLHDVPFSILKEGRAMADARLARVEEVEVGNERRKCYVIEGALPPAATVAELKKSTEPPTLGIQWLVSMLALQGLAEQAQRAFYSPWPDENGTTAGDPTLLTLWIDQASHLLVRSSMSTYMYKRGVGNDSTGEPEGRHHRRDHVYRRRSGHAAGPPVPLYPTGRSHRGAECRVAPAEEGLGYKGHRAHAEALMGELRQRGRVW